MTNLWNLLFAAGLLLAPLSGVAGDMLADPTRPANGVEMGSSADADSQPVLQSVLVSSRRREATISGHVVKVGDTLGDAKVVRIAEEEVVLRRGKTLQTLSLFPYMPKKAVANKAAATVNHRH